MLALPDALETVSPWRPAPAAPPLAKSTNLFMYLPTISTEADADAARAVLRANQYPADRSACERALLVYDDALGTGLGYTSRLMLIALLVAVKERRVLMLAPHKTNRWCSRAPYTLNCVYEPWTHCPLPANTSAAKKWGHQ